MTLVRRFKAQAEKLAGQAWQDLGPQPDDPFDIERFAATIVASGRPRTWRTTGSRTPSERASAASRVDALADESLTPGVSHRPAASEPRAVVLKGAIQYPWERVGLAGQDIEEAGDEDHGVTRSAGFLAADRRDPIDGPIERRDDADPGPFRARDQVGIGEVKPVDLVDLDGPPEQIGVEHPDGGERQDGPERRRHLRPRRLVERLEDVGHFSKDQIRQQQLVGSLEVAGRPRRQVGWIAGEVPDEDVGIDERRHRCPAARARRVWRRTSAQGVPRFAAGTLTDPAKARRSGVRASTA